MKRLLLGALAALAPLLCASTVKAQNLPLPNDSLGYCFRLGAPGDQAISASCTITVYNAGTLTLSTIYSDAIGTPKANPFAAAANGTWRFYVPGGTNYDVRLSGGTPAMTPYTISTVASSGGVTSFSAGNLSPLFTTNVATSTSTPALTFSLTNAAANTVFGRFAGTTGAPSYGTLTSSMITPPGATTQVIYNDAGAFGASADMIFNNTTKAFTIATGGQPLVRLLAAAGSGKVLFGTGTNPFIHDTTGSGWFFTSQAAQDMYFGPPGDPASFVVGGDGSSGLGHGTLRTGIGSAEGALFMNDGTSSAGVFQGPLIMAGNGTPETNFSGRVGSIYMRGNGAAGTSVYIKETGTGTTGWVPLTPGGIVQTCGTAGAGSSAVCAETDITVTAKTVVGTVALISGTPSSVTVTSLPAFTGTNTYVCNLTNMTSDDTGGLQFIPVSATSFTIEGRDTATDVVAYSCIGN